MTTIINSKLGENRGKPRIWIEGAKLAREGYTPGDRYNLEIQSGRLILQAAEDGQYTVSKRTRNGRLLPIIDISKTELAELFDGVETLRVAISQGKIVISAHHQHGRIQERVARLIDRISNDEPLRCASLFHGGGCLDRAIHSGLELAGIKSKVGVVVEIDGQYLDASLVNNPELWDDNSILIESPVQDVNLGRNPPQVDYVCAGLPCTGASLSGRSKNKLKHAEDHSGAGALFFSFLEMVKALNPSIVIGENVVPYASTASMSVIRSVLNSLGYVLQERTGCGNEFGALEKRERFFFVAVSKGLELDFDIEQMLPIATKPACLNDVLLPFDSELVNPESWRTYDYLAEKEKRDIAKGSGFRRQLLDGSEPYCGTIGRGYNKARSSEPFLKHPTDDSLSRLLTPIEHARVKGIPESVIAGLSATTAHEVLGQSVIYDLFRSLGVTLGSSLASRVRGVPTQQWRHVQCMTFNPGEPTLGGEDFALADALIDLSTGRLRLDRAGRDAGWPIAEGYEGGIEVCIPQGAQEGMVLPLGAAMEDAHNATLDEAVMCLRSDLVAKLIRERGHEVLIDLGSPAGQKLKGLLAPSFDAVKSVA